MDGFRVSPVSTCFFLNIQTLELRVQPLSKRAEATRVLEVPVPGRRVMERSFTAWLWEGVGWVLESFSLGLEEKRLERPFGWLHVSPA